MLIAVCALVVQCNNGPAASRPRARPTVRKQPSRRPPAQTWSRDQLPRPRALQTISKIDWKAFPDDRRGGYGSSGRQIVVKPSKKSGAIAAALARAKDNDTIVVHGGTYLEGTPDDDGALRIQQKGLVLRAAPGAKVRVLPQGKVTKRGVLISASNVLIDGIDLVGFSAMGIGIGQEGATLKGIILSNVSVRGPKVQAWVDGITIWPAGRASGNPVVDGLLLRNVTVENVTLGVSCNNGPCDSIWLENVRVKTRGGGGSSGADAIAVERGEDVVMVNVEVSGATGDGIDMKAGNVLVLNSRVHDVSRNGIKLWRGGDVINTVVYNTGADASFVFEKGRYRVLNSVLAYHNYRRTKSFNLTAGHGINAPVRVELINSIFYKTSGGMYFSDNTALSVRNCIFFGMQNRMLLRARARGQVVNVPTSDRDGRALQRLGLGSGNRVVDPRFVAPERGDFRLRPDSPARDRGIVPSRFPATDMAGRPRIRGKKPDIGPLER